jgi:hypothetical protein
MRHPRGRVVLAAVFALLALNALVQAALVPLGHSDDPPALTALQAVVGAAAVAAAWGSWTGTRWAPWAALLYGLVTAGMLAALGPLVALDADARRGVWIGAAVMLAFGLWAAWYLRRT